MPRKWPTTPAARVEKINTGGFAQKPVPFTILSMKNTSASGKMFGITLSNKALCSSTTFPPSSSEAVVCTRMKVADSAPDNKDTHDVGRFCQLLSGIAHVDHRGGTRFVAHEHQAEVHGKVNNLVQEEEDKRTGNRAFHCNRRTQC